MLVFLSGRFLCSMLEIVMRWHGDKKTYEKVSHSKVVVTKLSSCTALDDLSDDSMR